MQQTDAGGDSEDDDGNNNDREEAGNEGVEWGRGAWTGNGKIETKIFWREDLSVNFGTFFDGFPSTSAENFMRHISSLATAQPHLSQGGARIGK